MPQVSQSQTVNGIRGLFSSLGLAAGTTTQVKAAAGTIVRVVVTTAGSAAGAVYDSATTGGIGAANLVSTIPNTVGPLVLEFPMLKGIVVVTGTGQVASVSYS